jgi:hypothetical protein
MIKISTLKKRATTTIFPGPYVFRSKIPWVATMDMRLCAAWNKLDGAK